MLLNLIVHFSIILRFIEFESTALAAFILDIESTMTAAEIMLATFTRRVFRLLFFGLFVDMQTHSERSAATREHRQYDSFHPEHNADRDQCR
jgi:hypothetical protein